MLLLNSQELLDHIKANQLSPHPDNVILDDSLDQHVIGQALQNTNLNEPEKRAILNEHSTKVID